MGRTKRKRNQRKHQANYTTLDSYDTIISLEKWMSTFKYINDKRLKLRNFQHTGRGVTSAKHINVNERLIEIPYDLMITFTVLSRSEIFRFASGAKEKFKMQDLLAAFLVVERHKGHRSKWKAYLDTLPSELPPLPWLCTDEELERVPYELRTEIRKRRWSFETSWERVKKSIHSKWTCLCCKEPLDRVITMNSFTWGYVMVNTRAVYVDPDTVLRLSGKDPGTRLSDEPCIALCPFLDMFNHSDAANTNANLFCEGDVWKYVLTTLDYHKKYEQIFISYGGHDNVKLLCEYGFFLLRNSLDCVIFQIQDLVRTVNLNEKQYKCIRDRFKANISVSLNGLSFNLKAVLYIMLNGGALDWNIVIFSASYSTRDMKLMYDLTKNMLLNKRNECVNELSKMLEYSNGSRYFVNVVDYFKYKLIFINMLLIFIDEELKKF